MTERMVFAQEVSARFARTLLGSAEERLGAEPVAEMVRALGVRRPEVEDETAWLALSFCEDLLEGVAARGGEELVAEAGRAGFKPKALGFLYPFVRAFASPEFLYKKLVDVSSIVNKVGGFELVALASGSCTLEYRAKEGAPRERTRLMCILRSAQLSAVPTIFGLPAARLEETQCQVRGAPSCRYEFRWLPAAKRTGTIVGAALGAALGASTVWLASGLQPHAVFFAVPIVLGAALGALRDGRREIVRRGSYLEEQNAALAASAEATERRFQEVVEAKRDVDHKVEVRTAELNEALEKLRELDRAKTDFFSNVSHELRTPLTLILAPLEAMLADVSRVRTDDLATMHRNAVRLLRLINQILDLAKVDARGMRIKPVPTDLLALVRQISAPFDALARARGVTLASSLRAGMPPVPIDAERVEMAVSNLLANALKFTPPGGRVDVGVRADGDDAVLEIADTGPGIAAEEQGRVFERFAQASQGARRAGGTGIGLALVKEIVLLHGGNIDLFSRPGAGTRFVVRLPLAASRIPETSLERRQADVPVAGGRRREDADPFTGIGGSIGALAELESERTLDEPHVPAAPERAPLALVVEDHDELRAFMTRIVAERCRVVSARDGEEALAKVAESPPDIVVSDVMMPRMDGFALCRHLKEDVRTRPIPVILVTAKTGVERVLEGFASGADDYVQKPFNREELLARLDVHLRLRALVQEVAQRDKLAMLGTVAAGMAHEVRNPLTAVQGLFPRLGQMLEKAGALDTRTADVLSIAKDALGRIERVTRDLLDLSHVDREGARAWDPREGVEAAVRLLAARGGDSAKVALSLGPPRPITCRPGEINQVLLNVLDNAIRAAGPSGKVSVATRVEGERYVVEIADDGPGIPADVLPRVFDPFFTTQRAGQGTGLGLAIAKKIMTEHGGSIDLSSDNGAGTRVRIALPVAAGRDTLQSPGTARPAAG